MKKIINDLVESYPALEPEIIDVSTRDDLVAQYDIQQVPTIIMPDGSRLHGAVGKSTFKQLLDESLQRIVQNAQYGFIEIPQMNPSNTN
jgi:thioredoxin-like negative regulator of GroEL